MLSKGKYVVGSVNLNHMNMARMTGSEDVPARMSIPAAVCFPAYIEHSQIAGQCFIPGTITGAGFFTVQGQPDGQVLIDCYGRSDSLGIESQPADLLCVKQALGWQRQENKTNDQ